MSANDVISRMSPSTLVAFLGDLVEMVKIAHVDLKLISLAAYELLASAGSDAIMMLSEASVEHPLIDAEIAMFAEEMELSI